MWAGAQASSVRLPFSRWHWVLPKPSPDYNRGARQACARILRGVEVSVDMYAGRTLNCKQRNKALYPVIGFSALAWSGPGCGGAWPKGIPIWQSGPE